MPRKHLVFDGLDTVAEVMVNGQQLLRSESQFRRYVVDVSKVVKVGDNRVEVACESAVEYAKKMVCG